MADWAHEWTDERIAELERKFEATYAQAAKEMREKLDSYLEGYGDRNDQWKADVKSGAATQEQYDAWLKGQSMRREYLIDMTNALAEDAADTDQLAADYINDELPSVFAENANWTAFQIEQHYGTAHSFALYDRDTVRRIMGMDEDDQIMHEVVLKDPKPPMQSLRVHPERVKDVRWNRQKFTASIVQSILQGESIPNTAKRLERVLNMDKGMATRAARTAMTSAENAGRVDSYRRAVDMGLQVEQRWMATLDLRTRQSHRELDKQHVPVGQYFVVPSNGHKLRFPADPEADGSETWNCRCTLVAWFPDSVEDVDRWSKLPEGMTYEQWKGMKESQEPSKADLDTLKANLEQKEKELQDALSVKKPYKSYGYDVDFYRNEAERYKSEMEKLSWAKDLNEEAIERKIAQVERRLDEVNDKRFTVGLSREEKKALNSEYERLLKEYDKAVDQKYAIKDYRRVKLRYEEMRDRYIERSEAVKDKVDEYNRLLAEYNEVQSRIPELVKAKNSAIRQLSEAQPFGPQIRSALGDEYADAMEAMLDAAQEKHPELADAFRMFSSQLKISDSNLQKGAYYKPSERGIYFNAEAVAKGSGYLKPYQTAFHEFGHLIDNVSQYGYKYIGAENGLQDVIKSDWAKFRNKLGREHGVTRNKNEFAIKTLKEEMRNTENGLMTYADVSDIIEGCTKQPYPLGFGHGVSYHKNNPDSTAHEFVAELFDSALANEGSYKQMKRIFPNAVALVESIFKEVTA